MLCVAKQRGFIIKITLFALCATFFTISAHADSPKVVKVHTSKSADNWRFDVTIKHGDEGWNHYADGWGIYLPDGTELGYRVLAHPHVNEQPFTRSLGGVTIPKGTESVIIRSKDKVHGLGADFIYKLP